MTVSPPTGGRGFAPQDYRIKGDSHLNPKAHIYFIWIKIQFIFEEFYLL
jgi:hypothetical protein